MAIGVMAGVGLGHPADENPDLTLPETTREYRQDRFGLFIHWGAFSTLADGEAVMRERRIPAADYERLGQFFNPAAFDAGEWVELAKAAGAKYITFSAKHRDGFAMWDSAASDWNVVDRTPFKRDVVAELAEECRRQRVKLFLHYSPVDWHLTGQAGETSSTVEFTNAQLRELLTKYGKMDGVWLDGWPRDAGSIDPVYSLIRRLQPATLIGNNHGDQPLPGEDFQIRDLDLRPSDTTDLDELEFTPIPSEMNDTINESRGFRLTDNNYKSARELVHRMVRAAGADSNYQLNVGAMPDGRIQRELADRLRLVGMWLAKNGEGIYATRGGPVPPQPWGVTTHRRNKIFVHVLDPETTSVELQVPTHMRSARYLLDEGEVPFERTENSIILKLRPERRGELERLIVLETRPYEG